MGGAVGKGEREVGVETGEVGANGVGVGEGE